MKKLIGRPTVPVVLSALCLLLLILSLPAYAQGGAGVQQFTANQATSSMPNQGGDLIEQLNLTPEQRQQIRTIRLQNRAEQQAANQRLRQAQLALEEAIYADNPDDAVVEERTRELSEAQAQAAHARVRTQLAIRRVLKPEQINTVRRLQQEQREAQRLKQLENQRNRQNQRNQQRAFDRPNKNPNATPKPPSQRNATNRPGQGPLSPRLAPPRGKRP